MHRLNSIWHPLTATCIIIFLIDHSACPQQGISELALDKVGATGLSFQLWKADNDKVHQFAIPITFIYPVSEKLRLTMVTSPAASTYESYTTVKLNGFSDSRFSGTYLFGEDKFMATFGINIPSGKNTLNIDEFSVANVLALRALDFQVPILGQGLDISAGIVAAKRLGGFVVALGTGYLMRGPFEPIENAVAAYNPGDEITISLGIDRAVSRKNKLMFSANYTIYGEDTIEKTAVFKSGNKISLQGVAYFPGETMSFLFSAVNRIRRKNKVGSGDLIPERQNSNGNELEISATGYLKMNLQTTMRGVFEGKFYSNNAYNVAGASIGGFGAGLSTILTPSLSFDADLIIYAGTMNTGLEDINLTGLKIFLGVTVIL